MAILHVKSLAKHVKDNNLRDELDSKLKHIVGAHEKNID